MWKAAPDVNQGSSVFYVTSPRFLVSGDGLFHGAVDCRHYRGADVETREGGVFARRIDAVAEENVEQVIFGIDPKASSGEADVTVGHCRCFGRGRCLGDVDDVGTVKTETAPRILALGGCEQVDCFGLHYILAAV